MATTVVVDARELVVAIENVDAAIDQIAQTTLRNIVEQHSQDEVLAETSVINGSIRESWTPPRWRGMWR